MQECEKKQSKAANNKIPRHKHSALRSYENTDMKVFPHHKYSKSGTYPETRTSGYVADWSVKVRLSAIDITDDGGFSLTEHFHWQHMTFEASILKIPWNLLQEQRLRRRDHICKPVNNAVLLGAVLQSCSRVMKVEGPTVTPAARCERAPLRARAVSPAGITTSALSSGFREELWSSEARPAGPRQTDTLRGSVGSSPLRRSQWHRDKEDVGLSPTSAAHFSKCCVWVLLRNLNLWQLFLLSGLSTDRPPEADSLYKQRKEKSSKVINSWRKFRCMEQTNAAFTCSDAFFLWRQPNGNLNPGSAANSGIRKKALWKISMFYLLIHPFHRHRVILLELWNSPGRHIVAAFREIYIQHSGGEKVNVEQNGRVSSRRAETETISIAMRYLMRRHLLLLEGIPAIL